MATSDPAWIRLPSSKVLAVDGNGPPGGKEFQRRLHALYGVTYTLKFDAKKGGHDFRIAPLEGLWWVNAAGWRPGRPFRPARWRLQIPVPSRVTSGEVRDAHEHLRARRDVPFEKDVSLRTIPGGSAVQLLHVGPYSEEGTDLDRMATFAREGHRRTERWHEEVYLSDPRRVPPRRLRTILRRRVRPRP